MNTMKRLLAAALVLGAAHVHAVTNQTYLAPRPVGVNLAMESVTFSEMINEKGHDRFGGTLQVTGFYSESDNAKALGRYFGANNKSTIDIGNSQANYSFDRNGRRLIHDNAKALFPDQTTPNATLQLAPKQTVWGMRFDYNQDLSKILDGLYFRVQLPVVKVENTMGLTATGTPASDLIKYFDGTYSKPAGNANAQKALTNAKMAGKNSETAVADIDMQLGYTVLEKEAYRLALNIGLTLPTGNTPEAINAFEAVAGNGGHVALGAGFDFGWRVWGDDNSNVKLNAALNYRYGFEATEKRTLATIDSTTKLRVNLSPYNSNTDAPLVGANRAVTTSHLNIPTANILSVNCNITPGSMLDGIVGLAYNNGGLSIDAGYNIFFKEKDSVKMKDTWNDTTYSSTVTDHDFSANSNAANANLSLDIIDTTAARNEVVSHKVYGQIGYIFKGMEYPVMLGTGGHYEFAGNNGTVQNWGINLKAGISF